MDDQSPQVKSSSEQVFNPFTPATTMKFDKPLSGLFAINKPSGVTSMSLLESLKHLFSTSRLFVENPGSCHQTEKINKRKNQFWKKKRQSKLIKIGQGGTLDPLASGILIIGLNSATKKLSEFLNCSKVYRTTGILGCKTDSYDCDGKIVGIKSWKHVKPEDIEKQCQSMKGEHWQIPPIYSALKMDGKPLYEYARKNIPLPKPIEARKCEIFDIKMTEWKEGGMHSFKWPTEKISEEAGKIFQQVEHLVRQSGVIKSTDPKKEEQVNSTDDDNQISKSTCKRSTSIENTEPDSKKPRLNNDPTNDQAMHTILPIAQDIIDNQIDQEILEDDGNVPAFTLEMTVSSGTYVRTIVHDIGQAISSAATVVSLIRTRQGKFCLEGQSNSNTELNPNTSTTGDYEERFGCIEWSIFEKAIQDQKNGIDEPCNEVGLREWEQQLLKHIQT